MGERALGDQLSSPEYTRLVVVKQGVETVRC